MAFVAGHQSIGGDYDQAGISYEITTYGPVAGFVFLKMKGLILLFTGIFTAPSSIE